MYQRHWHVLATVALLAAAFWTSGARADERRVTICFAPEDFKCHLVDKYIKVPPEKMASVSESGARQAAQAFCKPGKPIQKTVEQREHGKDAPKGRAIANGVDVTPKQPIIYDDFHSYEFECDRLCQFLGKNDPKNCH